MKMKSMLTATVILVSVMSFAGTADAAGCLKGAIIGGIAGHYAGHHGLLGASAGCLIGRHYAHKHARQDLNNNTGFGSSTTHRKRSVNLEAAGRFLIGIAGLLDPPHRLASF